MEINEELIAGVSSLQKALWGENRVIALNVHCYIYWCSSMKYVTRTRQAQQNRMAWIQLCEVVFTGIAVVNVHRS